MLDVPCPVCKAQPGDKCISSVDGKPMNVMHGTRKASQKAYDKRMSHWALAVPCPDCGARAGEACVTNSGSNRWLTTPHRGRRV